MDTNLKNQVILWRAFKSGDITAYEKIYKDHYTILYNYGMHISGNIQITRDSIQNIFIDLWRSKDKLSDTYNIKFYLFKCLRRKIIDEIITEKNKESYKPFPEAFIPSFESELVQQQMNDEIILKLKTAINNLSEKQREIIFLRYYENLNHDKIAEILGMNKNTVYNTMSLAIQSLKKQLNKQIINYLIVVFYALLQ